MSGREMVLRVINKQKCRNSSGGVYKFWPTLHGRNWESFADKIWRVSQGTMHVNLLPDTLAMAVVVF